MEPAIVRRPKLHFDVGESPSHVTFDDGTTQRRNVPWMQYTMACWDYAEPDLIHMEIGDSVVEIRGHNLAPLYQAIEEQTLLRIRAQPDLSNVRDRELDTFATGIRFLASTSPRTKDSNHDQLSFILG